MLRLGHRIQRDKRTTTHVALVARAFGADQMFIDTEDNTIEETIHSICERFGGAFTIKTGVNAKKIIRHWPGIRVHLTMYGEELSKALKQIKRDQDLLIIVGAEKVPAYVYQEADCNIAVGNQPHSEVAALAVFLDHYSQGKWRKKQFNGTLEILPCNKGKHVISKQRPNTEGERR